MSTTTSATIGAPVWEVRGRRYSSERDYRAAVKAAGVKGPRESARGLLPDPSRVRTAPAKLCPDEAAWLGRWVTLPNGAHGYVWCLAPARGGVWVLLLDAYGTPLTTNRWVAYAVAELTVTGSPYAPAEAEVLPEPEPEPDPELEPEPVTAWEPVTEREPATELGPVTEPEPEPEPVPDPGDALAQLQAIADAWCKSHLLPPITERLTPDPDPEPLTVTDPEPEPAAPPTPRRRRRHIPRRSPRLVGPVDGKGVVHWVR